MKFGPDANFLCWDLFFVFEAMSGKMVSGIFGELSKSCLIFFFVSKSYLRFFEVGWTNGFRLGELISVFSRSFFLLFFQNEIGGARDSLVYIASAFIMFWVYYPYQPWESNSSMLDFHAGGTQFYPKFRRGSRGKLFRDGDGKRE